MSDLPNLFPSLDAATEAALRESIQRFGVLVPVVRDQHGRTLDGHHRSRIAQELGVSHRVDVVTVQDDDEAREIAATLNNDRRQLSADQRREVVTALREQGHSLRAIAGAVGASKSQVERDLSTVPEGTVPETITGIDGKSRPAKRPTIVAAKNEREAERAQVALAEVEPEDAVTNVRDLERAARKVNRPEPAPVELPEGSYSVLYVDPPWRYEHVPMSDSRAVENQYPTMTLDELKALPVPAADDAVLFMWATSPKLAEAVDLMDVWGFDYRTCAVWVKDRIGMGYYFRQQHELLLVGRRGEGPVPVETARPSSVVNAPRGEHSAKPIEVYDLINRMYPGVAKVELFARCRRDGWDAWGNQAHTEAAA